MRGSFDDCFDDCSSFGFTHCGSSGCNTAGTLRDVRDPVPGQRDENVWYVLHVRPKSALFCTTTRSASTVQNLRLT